MVDRQIHSSAANVDPVMNLPNILTIIRLVLVPVFLVCALIPGHVSLQWAALLIFMVAAATDHFDGKIARERGLVTNFGKIWDPIADKALTLGAFVALNILGAIGWWFTIIVAIRELGITWLRSYLVKRGIVVAASMAGKLKTMSQMLLITFCLFPWATVTGRELLADPTVNGVRLVLIVVALVLTLYSGWGYVSGALRRRG